MTEQDNGRAICLRIQPGPAWHTDPEGTRLLQEPHHLLLPEVELRLTDCRCTRCLADGPGILSARFVSPAELLGRLQAENIASVDFLPHTDLLLPGPSGEVTGVARFLNQVADVLRAGGVEVQFIQAQPIEPGTWVRTVSYDFSPPSDVLVPGLLGQVHADPWGLCTPGVSTNVQLIGGKEPHGLGVERFEVLDAKPTEEELQEAAHIAKNALDLYEQAHGFTGYLKVGKGRFRSEEEVRRELCATAARMPKATGADRRGLEKRVWKLLQALADRASAPGAAVLLEEARRKGLEDPGAIAAIVEYTTPTG
jgi:hypothetical protein